MKIYKPDDESGLVVSAEGKTYLICFTGDNRKIGNPHDLGHTPSDWIDITPKEVCECCGQEIKER